MPAPPHFAKSSSRALRGNVAVSFENPLTHFGLTVTIAPDDARALAKQLVDAADAIVAVRPKTLSPTE